MAYTLRDACLCFETEPLISGASTAIGLELDPLGGGAFLTARAEESSSRLRFDLGSLTQLRRYTACHRDESYWMKPRAGVQLSELPPETQSLIAEREDGRWLLLVPLIDDPFRFSLRGKKDGSLELIAETNDPWRPGLGGLAAFVAIGDDPFELVQRGARSVAARLGSGPLRREKPLPDFVDDFGWCTWDAFYQDVSQEKVQEGLASFAAGGVSPRFLILDDGWQSTARRATGEKRLTAFEANDKFPGGLAGTVQLAKQEYGVRTFLVWHAIVGYWGGVDGESLSAYGVVDQPRQFGEGVLFHVPNTNYDWWGNLVGFVPPAQIARFYDDYHGFLASQGVDGVKVDSQAVLEAIGQGHGGRVAVTHAYREGLERSVQRHFGGRLINCMSNAQETWYGSPASTLIRSSIDFFPKLPESHGAHLYTNAQVGLWFGEFMHPDWDMFQSGHLFGAYHAASRAISGGPVYVSDKPGAHDFALLSKLVCSDGSVLRADQPALPTLDCLCHDPTREDVLLKLWTRAGKAGVIGVFHARYSGDIPAPQLESSVSASDVPGLEGDAFACYAHGARTLERLEPDAKRALLLVQAGYEIFTFAPIEHGFAAIGLADKFNSAAAIASAELDAKRCVLELRDGGELLAYAERPPRSVEADGAPASFRYDAESRELSVTLAERRRQRVTIEW